MVTFFLALLSTARLVAEDHLVAADHVAVDSYGWGYASLPIANGGSLVYSALQGDEAGQWPWPQIATALGVVFLFFGHGYLVLRHQRSDLKGEIDRVETGLQRVEGGLRVEIENVEGKIGKVDAGLKKVEKGLKKQIGKVEKGLKAEIGKVEEGLKAEIGKVEKGLKAEIGRTEGKIGKVETGLGRVEKGLKTEIGKMESKVGKVKTGLGKLEKGLEKEMGRVEDVAQFQEQLVEAFKRWRKKRRGKGSR